MVIYYYLFIKFFRYFQVSCSQQNGSSILSNLVLNNSIGNQSQGNIIQKSLNQFAKNRVLPNNLQQTLNSRKSQNLQSQGSQQGANVQQLVNLQTLNSQQPSNLETVSQQQPINLQSVTTQQPMRLQSVNHQQTVNFQTGNTQQSFNTQSGNAQQPLNIQQSTLSIQPIGNLQQSLSQQQLQQTSLSQQNSNVQNRNPTLSNVQILRQISDVSSPANSGQFVQTCQGANVPSCSNAAPTAPVSTTTLCINNAGGETVPVICPQNQQNSISAVPSGVPSYVIDRSQISNAVPSSMAYTTAQGNQPSLLTVLAVPQQNQQPREVVQNPTETPNQITIIKSVQPHSPAGSTANRDPSKISVLSPVGNQSPPSSYSALLPSVSSILASTLSNQASKSSNVNALLPLILNLIKERNSCGCNHHCGCSSNNYYEHNEDVYRSYPKPKRYGFKPEGNAKFSSDYSKEFEEHGRHEDWNNKKIYGKHKDVKPVSVEISEYDYSDEFYEDD